jgi:hypothetical protein
MHFHYSLGTCWRIPCQFLKMHVTTTQLKLKAGEKLFLLILLLPSWRGSFEQGHCIFRVTSSEKRRPSWECNRYTASEKKTQFGETCWPIIVLKKKSATCPYLEPNESTPCHKLYSFKIHFDVTIPLTPCGLQVVSSFRLTHQNYVCICLLSRTCRTTLDSSCI